MSASDRLMFDRHLLEWKRRSRCLAIASATSGIVALGLPAWVLAAVDTSACAHVRVDEGHTSGNRDHVQLRGLQGRFESLTLHCVPNLQPIILSASVSLDTVFWWMRLTPSQKVLTPV